MIGYICKYTPVEIFESMGVEMKRIEPRVTNFTKADTIMHANTCSYVKAVLEEFTKEEYEGIVLTTCCDSVRRLFDTLKEEYPEKFIYLLDIPRKLSSFTISIYRDNVEEMLKAYRKFSGKLFCEDSLRKKLTSVCNECGHINNEYNRKFINIGIAGARCSEDIIKYLKLHNVNVIFDMTCTGLSRKYKIDESNVLNSYLDQLLRQMTCMRMVDTSDRFTFIKENEGELDGIIYHTMKFCDNFSYEYTSLRDRVNVPLLQIETDATSQSLGQIRTRLEAFIEEIEIKKGLHEAAFEKTGWENDIMYILGMDSGSTSTNAVIIDRDKNIIATKVIRTGAKTIDSAELVLKEILKESGLKREDIGLIVSTGYGRVSIPFADKNITEISCHGKGAHFLNPEVRTILDIGGQDSKAIKLNDKGEVVDFAMNDKCAAGTGRFLEMMARTLEIGIEELGPISLKSKENIEITSMCSVFAESEVISLIALNKEKSDIAHGVHKAIAGKAMSLLKKVGLQPGFMMTGGVARNEGVIKVLEKSLGSKLFIYKEPDIVGALGAALFGAESIG